MLLGIADIGDGVTVVVFEDHAIDRVVRMEDTDLFEVLLLVDSCHLLKHFSMHIGRFHSRKLKVDHLNHTFVVTFPKNFFKFEVHEIRNCRILGVVLPD